MIEVWVEASGANAPLASAELDGALEALGGRRAPDPRGIGSRPGRWVLLPDRAAAVDLGDRLALGRRCLLPVGEGSVEEVASALRSQVVPGRGAAFRPLGAGRAPLPDELRSLAAVWRDGGGAIRLERPEVRFWFEAAPGPRLWLGEEVAAVDRRRMTARRMPTLPFRRPVSLPPDKGRVAANLARAGPGRRVVDPFLGTGALLAEAALLGATVSGSDRDPDMVRGALRNFEHLHVEPELLKVADAGRPFEPVGGGLWDAVLTDPPYGRSSGTHGEAPEVLLARTLPAWAPAVRPNGYLALVAPSTVPRSLGSAWTLVDAVPDRVHRSLTREFRVYRRPA